MLSRFDLKIIYEPCRGSHGLLVFFFVYCRSLLFLQSTSLQAPFPQKILSSTHINHCEKNLKTVRLFSAQRIFFLSFFSAAFKRFDNGLQNSTPNIGFSKVSTVAFGAHWFEYFAAVCSLNVSFRDLQARNSSKFQVDYESPGWEAGRENCIIRVTAVSLMCSPNALMAVDACESAKRQRNAMLMHIDTECPYMGDLPGVFVSMNFRFT